jgi:ZIP family zinc transporter
MIPTWPQAAFWELVSGAALVVGAAIGYFAAVPPRIIAGIMALGTGVLVDTMVPEAYEQAGPSIGLLTALGFLAAFGLGDGKLKGIGMLHPHAPNNPLPTPM